MEHHTPRPPHHTRQQRGMTTLMVIGFMVIFMLLMGATAGYAFQQSRYGRALYTREQAIEVAEAGLEYYKWFLAHNPSIMTNGSGIQTPYSYTLSDPEGGTVGSAQVTVTPSLQCGRVQWLDISSRGTATSDTRFPRTLNARYMKPSIGEYAFITNSAVYLTSAVVGPVHANVGVHMTGTNNSTVSAGQSTWTCTGAYGCTGSGGLPAPGEKPGVFGSGPNYTLWTYPVATVDFSRISADFPSLKTYAQADGIMLNPTFVTRDGVQQGSSFSTVGSNEQMGFHVVFKAGQLVDIYRVTATNQIASYNTARGYLFGPNYCWFLTNYYPGQYQCENAYDYPDIASETIIASNVSLPSDCSLIYSEAKTWISGTVSGKVTIVAADAGSYQPDIVIGGTINVNEGNLLYATTDGTTGLTAIAERSVRTAHRVPDSMMVRGALIAQSGYFGRDYYYYDYNVDPYNGGALSPYRTRALLTTNGTLVSALQAGTTYGTNSGFQARVTIYDRMQAFNPPPFTPSAYADYGYQLWREQ